MTNVVKRWEQYLKRDSGAGEGRLVILHRDIYVKKITHVSRFLWN